MLIKISARSHKEKKLDEFLSEQRRGKWAKKNNLDRNLLSNVMMYAEILSPS